MTTGREARRLKEAYRLALAAGSVANTRGLFQDGRIVFFRVDDATGFSDGLAVTDRVALAGQFQLRYWAKHHGQPSTDYAVYGRLGDSTDERDWIPVDGPWKCGEGPFDRKRR